MSILDPRQTRPDFSHPVVFFANGPGSTLLALPALRALATLFDSEVTMICDTNVGSTFLKGLRGWRIVETPMRRNMHDLTREFSTESVLDQTRNCDLFVSLATWMSDSLQHLLKGLAPDHSIGFCEGFAHRVPMSNRQHAADLMFGIPRAIDKDLRIDSFARPPSFDFEAQQIARRLRNKIPSSAKVLVVNAESARNKMWPSKRWVWVLDEFLDKHPDYVAMLIGSTPQPLGVRRHTSRIVPCYGLPLPVSLSLAGMADIFLGVDSCVLHAADLYRVPAVGLFGASDTDEHGFRFSNQSIAVRAASMDGIGVFDVLRALEQTTRQVGETMECEAIA